MKRAKTEDVLRESRRRRYISAYVHAKSMINAITDDQDQATELQRIASKLARETTKIYKSRYQSA